MAMMDYDAWIRSEEQLGLLMTCKKLKLCDASFVSNH